MPQPRVLATGGVRARRWGREQGLQRAAARDDYEVAPVCFLRVRKKLRREEEIQSSVADVGAGELETAGARARRTSACSSATMTRLGDGPGSTSSASARRPRRLGRAEAENRFRIPQYPGGGSIRRCSCKEGVEMIRVRWKLIRNRPVWLPTQLKSNGSRT